MILTGAIINAAAIAVGGTLGTLGGRIMPPKMKETLLAASALVSLWVAITGLFGTSNTLIPIFSLVVGSLLGELLGIENAVNRMGEALQKRFGGSGSFTEGFINGSLIFVAGAMSIMGALSSGVKNDHSILITKAIIDFAMSVAFGGSLGIGVAVSGVSVLVAEGILTLLASLLTDVLTEVIITEISVTACIVLLGIGTNLLGLTKLRVMNMTPALVLPVLFCQFM